MDITEIERKALTLSPAERARLVEVLLESLDGLDSEEVKDLWAMEAERRSDELNQGKATVLSAEDVFRSAREHLG